jgi:hydrogenase expression/formation protein HypE
MASTPSATDREEKILGIIERTRAKRPKFRDGRITMAHGAGGKATGALIEGLLLPAFASPELDALGDAGMVEVDGIGLALTTDAFVVTPLRFPGGSIGELAVNGTVNDLAMSGARPLVLTLSFILEEGLDSDVLRAEVDAVARAAREAGVRIVAGDTKVVPRGAADGLYITTTGLGRRDGRARLAPDALRPGDRLLLSGPIGEHGTAIMLARGEFDLDADIVSDTRSLWPAVDLLLDRAGAGLRCLRDATRGGVASVLNELARASGGALVVQKVRSSRSPAVAGAAERLGIDPECTPPRSVLVAAVARAREAALGRLRFAPGVEQPRCRGWSARTAGARGDRVSRRG